MANFNKSVKKNQSSKGFSPMMNHEDSTVHKMTDLETLFSQVLGSFFGEATFYEKKEPAGEFKKLYERIQRIPENDKEYILKIAELGRVCNMISFPLNIISIAFNDDRFLSKNFIYESCKEGEEPRNKLWFYADKIVQRTKDIITIMATQFVMFNNKSSTYIDIPNKRNEAIPMQLRKCLKRKIQSYDKFKLSKGISKSSDVTLKDCIKLLRPKPRNEDYQDFYKKILNNEVKVGNDKAQINTELTKKGQAKTKDNSGLVKAVSMDILQNIVKNLASLYRKNVFDDKEAVDSICKRLRDPNEVKNSKLLPFRFYSAYKEMENMRNDYAVRNIRDALIDALDLAVNIAEPIEGINAILVDLSGSMESSISENSVLKAIEVAAVLAAIAFKSGNGDLFAFSSECVRVGISKKAPVMDIANTILKAVSSSGTDLNKALCTIEDNCRNTGTRYDSLILLSDNDCYGYDKNSNHLTFDDRNNYWNKSTKASADEHINSLIIKGMFRKVWINNLLGNEFAIFNTASNTKNLIVGFSEHYLDMISVYNMIGGNKDIRIVIDMMLNKIKREKAISYK